MSGDHNLTADNLKAAQVGQAQDFSRCDDGVSRSSEFSSAPSLGRQVTGLSEAHCVDVAAHQCLTFQSRPTEYWRRQATAPAVAAPNQGLNHFTRQISDPGTSASAGVYGRVSNAQKVHLDSMPEEPADGGRFQFRSSGSSVGSGGNRSGASADGFGGGLIEAAISTAVSEHRSCIMVADPESLDADVISVSDGFLEVTGYDREELIGENCRFLNEGCPIPAEQRRRLSLSAQTGAPFVGVLLNRKKSGEVFLNLVHIRGLVIAQNFSNNHIWVLVGVQMDVTALARESIPQNHKATLHQIASRIHRRLLRMLGELGLMEMLGNMRVNGKRGTWQLLPDVTWRPGSLTGDEVEKSLAELPDRETLEDLPPLIGLSQRCVTDEACRVSTSAPTNDMASAVSADDVQPTSPSGTQPFATPATEVVQTYNPGSGAWLAVSVVMAFGAFAFFRFFRSRA